MLDFTRLMLISTQVEVVVEVGVELGNYEMKTTSKMMEMKKNIVFSRFRVQSLCLTREN